MSDTNTQGVGSSVGADMADLFGKVGQWLTTPFTTPLDPMQLALIALLLLAFVVGWNLVLYHIRIAGQHLAAAAT